MNRDLTDLTIFAELDHEDPQPNTRALWCVCMAYLVMMVSVVTAVKFIVTGSM